MINITDARESLKRAWPQIIDECRAVLGSELHYQAQIYHCLRDTGSVPRSQLGMNVKMYIEDCKTALFQQLDRKKHVDYRGGFEPIPDVVIFSPKVESDWRRRKKEVTLATMLLAIEVKASERHKGRLGPSEICNDIDKLAAHREEVRGRNWNFLPVMMVIDTAPEIKERMTKLAIERSIAYAEELDVEFMYLSQDTAMSSV